MAKQRKPTATIYLDSRKGRAKKNGKFTVKLRLYDPFIRKEKQYKTPYEFTDKEFQRIWESRKPKLKDRDIRMELEQLQIQANEVISGLKTFTFEAFEQTFFGTTGAKGHDVFSLYAQTIDELRQKERHGSADSYRCSINAIKDYLKYKKRRVPECLSFDEITPTFLNDFERFFIEVKGKSKTSVGVYARHLRAIFNLAKENGITDNYPFGRRKYQIPQPKAVKKALSFDQLITLSESIPDSPEQERAKDLFILSFCLYGINLKDLIILRGKDVSGDTLTFYRAKTIETSKANLKPITVPITERARQIIHKYRTSNNANKFIFDIVNEADSAREIRRKVQNLSRFVNQHLKPLAKKHNLPSEISYQWARHTFATLSVREGASMEFVSQALGHSDLKTTQNYFAGFDEDTGRNIMEKLTSF